MRVTGLVPLIFLLTGCLAPGERDPTRYPWDPRNKPALTAIPHPPIVARGAIAPDPSWQPQLQPVPQPVPPGGSYCVIAIEPQPTTGITVGGKAPGIVACSAPASPRPGRIPR
jgi:hypothetical protein